MKSRNGFSIRVLGALAALVATAGAASEARAEGDSFLERARIGMLQLESHYHWDACHWYEPWTWGQLCQAGTWEPFPAQYWWNSANALTTTVDYTALSGDYSYLGLIENAYSSRHDSDYVARNFNDDEAWWALAWIDASDLLESRGYLERAQYIFNDMARYWDATCGGGIWWQKSPKSYKNTIANTLFLSVAAKLYRRTHDPRYLGWARAELHWFLERSGLFLKGQLIPDGLDDSNCRISNSGQASTWTYNQGVIIGALLELDMTALAKEIADTVLRSPLMAPKGILTETNEYTSGCSGWDCPQFKGVFMRNLGALHRALPDSDPDKESYGEFIRRNAEAIWARDRAEADGLAVFGVHWNGPVEGDLALPSLSAAMDALVAAIPLGSARGD